MSDYAYVADNVMEEEIKFSTLISDSESGYEERRSKRANPLRRFILTHSIMTLTEKDAIKNFFIAEKGAYGSFTWTNPNDSVEYTVRFESDTLKIKRQAFNVFTIQVSFMEVRT
jgi:phage-related protein